MSRTPTIRPQPLWNARRVPFTADNFGVDYADLNNHDGTFTPNWPSATYNATRVENDLAFLASHGITKIRVFATLESIMDYTVNGGFVMNNTYKANVQDFITRAANHGISIILVASRCQTPSPPISLDGFTRWELIQTTPGIATYQAAYTAYVKAFDASPNILMFEFANEPYSNATGFSDYAVSLSVTTAQCQAWLFACYATIKKLTTKYVGISEYEEEQQTKYQYFSSATTRKTYIDPCTDVYSMHIYRPDASWMGDFRALTGKPKWLSEVGHLNFTGTVNGVVGNSELYNQALDPQAVRSIATEALDSGFSLVMPWSVGDNWVIMQHNPDGTHYAGQLLQWINTFTTPRTKTPVSRTISS